MLDEEGKQRAFNQFMEIYVLPEIARRKEKGTLPKDFILKAAQVIFPKCVVRLNEETKLIGKAKLKDNIGVAVGEKIFSSMVERIENIGLDDEEEPKYAHISVVRIDGSWVFLWDARYNKESARKHLETAKQFYEAAKYSYQNKLWSPFVDNLFSATELLATGELLLLPDEKFVKKHKHKTIKSKYNKWVNIGNAKPDFKTALNKLSGLRDSFRYLKYESKLSESEAQKYLDTVKEMSDYVELLSKRY
jgi:hypothetical protein